MIERHALVVAALLAAAPAHALEVQDIATPRPAGWVADAANILDADAEAELNRLGDALHAQNGAEMAVVTVRSTGGRAHRAFATALYNHWGISSSGFLVFVAIRDRAAELILGDAVDGPDSVGAAERIMDEEMVTRFRRGDAQGAVLAGARAGVRQLLGYVEPAPEPEATAAAPATEPLPAPLPQPAPPPVAAVVDTSEDTAPAESSGSAWATIAGTLGGGGLLWLGLRRWLRNRPRRCDRCNAPMQRLDEAADDAQLGAAEKMEERLKSVDYDVWVCPACANVRKERYGALFTRYARCPRCSARTKSSTEQTLVAASYDHGGRVKVDEHCQHCGYRHSFEKSTPRKTRSSSSSGSSSSGFSGGSSSGRGASGRW